MSSSQNASEPLPSLQHIASCVSAKASVRPRCAEAGAVPSPPDSDSSDCAAGVNPAKGVPSNVLPASKRSGVLAASPRVSTMLAPVDDTSRLSGSPLRTTCTCAASPMTVTTVCVPSSGACVVSVLICAPACSRPSCDCELARNT